MKMNKANMALAITLGLTVAAHAGSSSTTQIAPTTTQAVYISGSSVFRTQIYNGLSDLGLSAQADDSSGNSQFTFTGTPNTNKVSNTTKAGWGTLTSAFTNTSVTVYVSLDGSVQGIHAAVNPSYLVYFENVETGGGYGVGGGQGGFGTGGASSPLLFPHASTFAFSDVEQNSTVYTSTHLNEIESQDAVAAANGPQGYGEGIVIEPFLWAANAAATASNVSNIDPSEAGLLFSGGALPLSYWTGNAADSGSTAADQVVLTGRDTSGGIRIIEEDLAPYPTTSEIYQYGIGITSGNAGGVWADPATLAAGAVWGPASGGAGSASTDINIDGGYATGSKEADAIIYPGATPAVAYLSWNDAKVVTNPSLSTSGWTTTPVAGSIINYNGVNIVTNTSGKYPQYNVAAVQNGEWPFWSYVHLFESSTVSAGSGYDSQDFGPGVVASIVYEVAQESPTTPITAILESTVNVVRTQDGASVVNNQFSPQ